MAYIETELYKILGSYLRVAREASGLTLSEVSKKIDTTPMTIQRYEKGDRKITVEKIRILCSLYGVDADKLMQDSIDTLRKDESNMGVVLSIVEEKMLSSFRALNYEGQSKAIGYVNDLVSSGNYSGLRIKELYSTELKVAEYCAEYAVAAHDRTDRNVSDEEKAHDLDLLNDDDF